MPCQPIRCFFSVVFFATTLVRLRNKDRCSSASISFTHQPLIKSVPTPISCYQILSIHPYAEQSNPLPMEDETKKKKGKRIKSFFCFASSPSLKQRSGSHRIWHVDSLLLFQKSACACLPQYGKSGYIDAQECRTNIVRIYCRSGIEELPRLD
jgi:hypothetical protein